VAIKIPERRGVVSAGADWRVAREANRFVLQRWRSARTRVLDQQQTGFEEVAPEKILIAVPVEIRKRHRVRAVQAGANLDLADDFDVLEPRVHEFEAGESARILVD